MNHSILNQPEGAKYKKEIRDENKKTVTRTQETVVEKEKENHEL